VIAVTIARWPPAVQRPKHNVQYIIQYTQYTQFTQYTQHIQHREGVKKRKCFFAHSVCANLGLNAHSPALHGIPLGLQCKNCQYSFLWQYPSKMSNFFPWAVFTRLVDYKKFIIFKSPDHQL
jgi:hypothetical protein